MSVEGEDNENGGHRGHEPHLTDEVDNDDNDHEQENETGHTNKGPRARTDSTHSDENNNGNGTTTNGGSGGGNAGGGTGGGGATNGQTNTNDPKNRGKMEQNEKAKLHILREAFSEASKTGRLNKKMLPPNVCRGECMKLWRQLLTTDVYKGIRVVRLRWCAIQSPGAKVLADGLINSCMDSLEILDLMGNEIGVSGTRAIAGLLAPGIDLDSFQVTDVRSVLAGFEGRERIGCLKTLNLAYNCTSDAGCGYLGKAICISNTIKRLSLENCEISDNGCKYLRRGIERNNTLTHLNISANRFGDLGAREIQTFLLRNNSLQYLDISRNRLGAQRTMDIAKGLTMNHSLKKLRMNINRTGARGAQVLAKMLINNHTLEELELSYNEIFNDGVQVLAQGLVQNHGLKKLVLWYNGLEDAAARQLARALSQRSKQPHFRNDMVQAVAESQSDIFFISDISGKLRPHPDTYPICEKIIDYVPIFMFFEVDLSHNRRITKNGFTTLLDVANSENICIQGLKELLSKDKKDGPAQGKASLY